MLGRAALVLVLITAAAEELPEVAEVCAAGAAAECSEEALELSQLRAKKQRSEVNESVTNETVSHEDCLEIFLAAQPEYNETPLLKSSQSSGHIRHGGNIRYLYHQTSTSAGPKILNGGFRRGHIGWCGGGIYFALSAWSTYHKAVGLDSAHGFIIEAKVDLGRTKYMPAYCTSSPRCWGIGVQQAIRCIDRSYQGGQFQSEGYDSIYFNPGDGGEFMIWDPSRVLSMRRVG
ncbi:unnamed protein product [Durusdinium trenchii]|uniref:PARP catalytic domain-containing protein n=1 Tax=Durusdinium trenchii TaxID=1381693 RepID=A0ABP0HFF1_9DINO